MNRLRFELASGVRLDGSGPVSVSASASESVSVSVSASASAHASHNAWQRLAESGLRGVCTGTSTLVRHSSSLPHSFAMRLPRSLRMYCSCCSWRSPVCSSQRSPRLERRSLGPTKSQGCSGGGLSRVCMQRRIGQSSDRWTEKTERCRAPGPRSRTGRGKRADTVF